MSYVVGGLCNKDNDILVSRFGLPYFGKLPMLKKAFHVTLLWLFLKSSCFCRPKPALLVVRTSMREESCRQKYC